MDWKLEDRFELTSKWVLFFISPVLGLIISLSNLKTKSSFLIIYVVGLLFGLSLTVEAAWGNEDVIWYADSMFHRAEFESFRFVSFDTFLRQIIFYFSGNGEKDIYAISVKFLVSRFTTNYHIFFLFIAAVYGYFSIKSLKFFVAEKNYENSIGCLLLVYLFLSAQILEVNGVRYYTAGWVAIYSLFQIFLNKDKKYLLLLLITPLIHSAFFLFIAILVLFQLIKKHPRLCVAFFFASFAISELFVQLLSSNVSFLPDFIKKSTEFYMEAGFESRGWFFDIFASIRRVYVNFLIVVIIITARLHEKNEKTKEMYLFVIFIASCANFFMSVPIFSSRLRTLLFPFLSYVWLVDIYKTGYNKVLYFMPLAYFYSMFFLTPRTYMRLLEPCFFYTSPLYLISKYFWI